MILYRFARFMRGRWDWSTCSMHQGTARDVIQAGHYDYSDHLVFAAPSITGLDYMLSIYNQGKRSCCMGVVPFLTGAFNETNAANIFNYILRGEPETEQLTPAMVKGMNRVLPPIPVASTPQAVEVKAWPREVIRRLEFYKWMVGTGRLTEEIEA